MSEGHTISESKTPFRYIQPVVARPSTPNTLETPFPIRSSSQQQQPRSSSNASSLSHSSTSSKRPVEIIDLLSSDDEFGDEVLITPKRHCPTAAFDFRSQPQPVLLQPAVTQPAQPQLQSSAPVRSTYVPSSSSSSSARFCAVQVPIRRPYAVFPKTPTAIAKRELFEKNLRELSGPKVTVVNEIDDSSPSTDFRFVQESILQAGVEHVAEDFMVGCTCYKDNGRQMGCEYLYCKCLDDSQLNDEGKRVFPYGAGKKDFRCLRNFYLESRNHIYECNKMCNCESNCKNRNVQHGRRVELEIFKTQNRGWGLRCPVTLRKGEFIDTYRGEIISVAESDRRGAKRSPDEANYFFNFDKFCEAEMILKSEFVESFPDEVEEYQYKINLGEASTEFKDGEEWWENPEYVEYEYVCDGMYVGSPTRFMNHSCEPNCRLFTVSYNHADTNLYDLAFFTLEDIPAGTELTFDYKDEDDRTLITDEQARQVQETKGYMPQKCLCGTAECRRYFFN